MQKIIKIGLILILALAFIYTYNKIAKIQSENKELKASYEALKNQFLVENNINFYE